MEKMSIFPKAKKIALFSGIVVGTIRTLTLLGIFYLAPKLLESVGSGLRLISIEIVLSVLFCKEIRRRIGGYWSFREALSLNFIMLYSSFLTMGFFTMAVGRLIDTSYYPKMKEIVLTRYDSFYKKLDAEKVPDFAEMRIKFIEELDKEFYPSIVYVLKSLFVMAIIYFIGALILAAIFKKKKPDMFVEQVDDLSAL